VWVVDGLKPAAMELFAICAMAAMADAVLADMRTASAVRVVCGLAVSLCVVRLAAGFIR